MNAPTAVIAATSTLLAKIQSLLTSAPASKVLQAMELCVKVTDIFRYSTD